MSTAAEAAYLATSKVLGEHWDDQTCAEFVGALSTLRVLAELGNESAWGALAEILALEGPHHNAAAAYKWYYVALAKEGYSVSYQNEHPDPGYYCGPVGDFRNEAMVNDLILELGLERVPLLDAEARVLLSSFGA